MTLFDLITRSQSLRDDILYHLYQARLTQPYAPGVAGRVLEEVTGGSVAFELGYLIERGYVASASDQRYCITADGIDQIEGGLKASA